jgi:hypothetical protein
MVGGNIGISARSSQIATTSMRRIVAIELGTWRCGRSEVDNHWEQEIFRLERRNVGLGGNPRPLGDQKTVGCDGRRTMMTETRPAAAVMMSEADFLNAIPALKKSITYVPKW